MCGGGCGCGRGAEAAALARGTGSRRRAAAGTAVPAVLLLRRRARAAAPGICGVTIGRAAAASTGPAACQAGCCGCRGCAWLLHRAGADRRRGEVHRPGAVVVAGAGRAEGDLVAVLERLLAANALAVDVRAVEAPQISEDEHPLALLEDAVLLRHDLVEKLDRVVGMPPEAVDRTQLDRLLPLGCREDQACHQHLACNRNLGRCARARGD